MKNFITLLLIVVTMTGCGLYQEKVDDIILLVHTYFNSDDFKNYVVKECIEFDYKNLYETDNWDSEATFNKILSSLGNSDNVVNAEKKNC
jgi:hypothetical protein